MPIGSPGHWVAETFSSAATEDDIIKSRSLNITRITGVVTPVLLGIATALGEVADQPPFDDVGFQRQLILALIGLIALVSVADIFGRSITAARASAAASTVLPSGLTVTKDAGLGGTDRLGKIVAFRTSNAHGASADGEYLFVTADGTVSWESAKSLGGVPA